MGVIRPETTVDDERAPVVRVDALETFVELLTRADADDRVLRLTAP